MMSRKTPSLKVIGAGLSRTGTLSLKTALDILVGPCYHGTIPTLEKHQDCLFWNKCLKDGYLDEAGYAIVLGGYKAVVDFPCVLWYKELIAKNPDAKVILTIRDPLKWRQSCLNSVGKYLDMTETWPCTWFHSLLGLDLPRDAIIKLPGLNMWEAIKDGEDSSTDYFNTHVNEVKKHVPADKLLVFEVQQGWDPLCSFLDLPVPDMPFPRTNDTNQILLFTNICRVMAWVTFIILPLVLAVAGLFLVDTGSLQCLLMACGFIILLVKKYVVTVLQTIWCLC